MNIGIIAPAEIVKMREVDVDSILEISAENELEAWSRDDLLAEIQRDDSIALTATVQTETIGFCIARLIRAKDVLNDIYCKNNNYTECEIYNIAIKRKYQRQGIGKQILNEVVILAKEHDSQSIWLEVRSLNSKAKNFYCSNNFKQIYERKNFYTNPPENAIVMKRNLKYP